MKSQTGVSSLADGRGRAKLGRDKRRGAERRGGGSGGGGWSVMSPALAGWPAHGRLRPTEPNPVRPSPPRPSPGSDAASCDSQARVADSEHPADPGAPHPQGSRAYGSWPSVSQPLLPPIPGALASRRPSPGTPESWLGALTGEELRAPPWSVRQSLPPPPAPAQPPPPGTGVACPPAADSGTGSPPPTAPPPRRPLSLLPVTQLSLCCDWAAFNERLGDSRPSSAPVTRPHAHTFQAVIGVDLIGALWDHSTTPLCHLVVPLVKKTEGGNPARPLILLVRA
ncbi:uncharacterized protein LOC144582435 [Callithrix jacchus]